jgi:hypothetical protein
MPHFDYADTRFRLRVVRLPDGTTLRATLEFTELPNAEKRLLQLVHQFLVDTPAITKCPSASSGENEVVK